MSNESWKEHRLLVLANFERHDSEIKALQEDNQKLKDKLRDQGWKMLIMAILGGIGGGGGVDLVKLLLQGFF